MTEMAESPFQFRLATSPDDIRRCQSLRHAIFVQEQNLPVEAEYDGKDDQAFHVLCEIGPSGQGTYRSSAHTTVATTPHEQSQSHAETSSSSPPKSIIATGRVLVIPFVEEEKSSKENDSSELPPTPEIPTFRAVLGRIAVRSEYRGIGLGKRVVEELEQVAKAQGATHASLTPHHYLERFYSSLGYHPTCPMDDGSHEERLIYINDHCQLISMEKKLCI